MDSTVLYRPTFDVSSVLSVFRMIVSIYRWMLPSFPVHVALAAWMEGLEQFTVRFTVFVL